MSKISKGLIGAAVVAAVAASSIAPASARDHRYGRGDGIDAGDVIAGALIIGGIAAIASAANNDRDYDRDYDARDYDRSRYGDYRYDRRGYDDYAGRYNRGNSRQAVEQCVRAAERSAGRYSYGDANVTDIREIRRTNRGYEVRGRVAVNGMGRDWRDGDRRYGNGWSGDYRGWNDRYRGYDSGTFKCRVDYGRVVDLDFSGIRGL